MMNTQMIEKTQAFLLHKFDGGAFLNANPEAKAYRIAHSFRVANIGRRIAREEGFDETEMVIACLLHDVSYCEDFGESGWEEHGRISARIARPFLEELGLDRARIGDICYGIAIHVDDKADFEGERTPFALTVGDADNIDRFDALRLHEMLCREDFLSMSLEDRLSTALARSARLRELRDLEMGTAAAAAIWRERIGFAVTFFDKLVEQLRSSTEILCD